MVGILKATLLQIEHTWQRSISGIVVSGCWRFKGSFGTQKRKISVKISTGKSWMWTFCGERDNSMERLRGLSINMAMVQHIFAQCLTTMESWSVKPPKTLINTVRLLLLNDVDRLKPSLGHQDLGHSVSSCIGNLRRHHGSVEAHQPPLVLL